MPGGFRRAELRGSDELFRPTRPDGDKARPRPASTESAPASEVAEPTPVAARPEGRLVRLTDEDIDLLCEAVQRLKYPTTKPVTKPPMDLFERLEELRSRLLEVR